MEITFSVTDIGKVSFYGMKLFIHVHTQVLLIVIVGVVLGEKMEDLINKSLTNTSHFRCCDNCNDNIKKKILEQRSLSVCFTLLQGFIAVL